MAGTQYSYWWYHNVYKPGVPHGLVDATPAREHLCAFAERGVGVRSLESVTGVAKNTLWKIQNGTRSVVLLRTHEAILGVDLDDIEPYDPKAMPGHLDAELAREHLQCLRHKGMSGVEISRQTGLVPTHIIRIREGRTRFITKTSHQAILAIPIPVRIAP